MCRKPDAYLSGWNFRLSKWSIFLKKLGSSLSALCVVSPGWLLAKNCLTNCYIPMELRNISSLNYQGQVIKGCPLGGFHIPPVFSWAGGELRGQGNLDGFIKGVVEFYNCPVSWASARQSGCAMMTCKVSGGYHVSAHPSVPAGCVESLKLFSRKKK